MVEIHASAIPWDGMVLSSSCDKSIPAHLKAIARLNIPAVFIPGGVMRPGPRMTTSLVAGDISLREKRKDAIAPQEIRDYKLTGCPSAGACAFLGTAGTMQCMAEALGLALPGSALMPATMRDILESAREAGCAAMRLAEAGLRSSDILTPAAFRNALSFTAPLAVPPTQRCTCPASPGKRAWSCPSTCLTKSTIRCRTSAISSQRQAAHRSFLVCRRRADDTVGAARSA